MDIVTRFAPSPTGLLHLGHAYAALFAYEQACRAGGRFLLRLEDIDQGRCRPEFEDAIYEDLTWLGLEWEQPVRRQSEHFASYQAAVEQLQAEGLAYPCFCTRKDIQAEIARADHAPHGPDGALYPGTCKMLSIEERTEKIARGMPYALRLDVSQAIARVGKVLTWSDQTRGEQSATPEIFGDVVLARKDCPTSYHLAVTWDDALQGVNLVTRGEDLFEATHVHRLLQALLGLPTPTYRHHGLLTCEDGRRLAKRDRSLTLRAIRDSGESPAAVRRRIGL